ncbi:MAG: hypothetical protein ACO1N9_03755 [Flavobacterium sp.]
MTITAQIEESKMVARDNGKLFGYIAFNTGNISATITVNDKEYYIGPESATEKDIVLKQNGLTLMKFKFDYLWGNAEIHSDGEDTGYDIKGRWFKSGTRFTDAEDNDLIVVKSKENQSAEISILDEDEATPIMTMATLYYHMYTSAAKYRSLLFSVST